MSGERRAPGGESRAATPSGCIARVTGMAIALRGDDVDTDRIMPARFLRAVTFEGLGEHVFEDDRKAWAARAELHPFDAPHAGAAAILVVNRNFGCGSSREHAPQGLLRRGIRAIVGESFAEIFFGNAASLGIPCLAAAPAAVAALMDRIEAQPRETVVADVRQMFVRAGRFSAPVDLPGSVRDAFLDGTWDATGLLLERFGEVHEAARGLPYMRNFD